MPSYVFRAIDRQGNVVNGKLTAPTTNAAQQQLQLVYKNVLSVTEPSEQDKLTSIAFRRSPRVKLENLALYCRQLAVMVNAGITVNRAFRFCAGGEDQNLNVVMQRVATDIEGGKSVCQALDEQPRVFGHLFVGLVKAGEMSGTLDKSLAKLSDLLEKTVTMQKRVQSAMSYPAVILVVSMAVGAFFTFYIMPQMLPVFTSLGVTLPLPTKILVWVATTLQNPWISVPLALLFFVGIFVAFSAYQKLDKAPEIRFIIDQNLLKIPVFGELLKLSAQAKVLYTMSTMLEAGSSLTETMQTVERVAGNQVISTKLKAARESVLCGVPLFQAMTLYEVFHPMALQMIKVGEETGTLDEMIGRVAKLHEEEVEHTLDTLASLIEPIIMGVMGIVVGFITISCFLPMVQLLNTL